LIRGGLTDFSDQNAHNHSNDDSFYLLNLGMSGRFHVIRVLAANLASQYRHHLESGPASWSMVPGPAVVTITP
jgi:hypothetical protein